MDKEKRRGWWGTNLYYMSNYFRVRAQEIFSNKFRKKLDELLYLIVYLNVNVFTIRLILGIMSIEAEIRELPPEFSVSTDPFFTLQRSLLL
ncbi:hypothetical protein IAI44_20805 [Bacillus cereus]|uniref:hypothetical protein n=1 Tax=Bacillus cereus TaxID=1396 RepID=UPI0035C67DF0